jgi:hypothetical protein
VNRAIDARSLTDAARTAMPPRQWMEAPIFSALLVDLVLVEPIWPSAAHKIFNGRPYLHDVSRLPLWSHAPSSGSIQPI